MVVRPAKLNSGDTWRRVLLPDSLKSFTQNGSRHSFSSVYASTLFKLLKKPIMPASKDNRGGRSNNGDSSKQSRQDQSPGNRTGRENVSAKRETRNPRQSQRNLKGGIERGSDFGNHLDEE
jgi:hypothetical protein